MNEIKETNKVIGEAPKINTVSKQITNDGYKQNTAIIRGLTVHLRVI